MKKKFEKLIIYCILILFLIGSYGIKSFEMGDFDNIGDDVETNEDSLPPPPETMDPKLIPSIDTSEPKPTLKPKVTVRPTTVTTTKPKVSRKPRTTTSPKPTTTTRPVATAKPTNIITAKPITIETETPKLVSTSKTTVKPTLKTDTVTTKPTTTKSSTTTTSVLTSTGGTTTIKSTTTSKNSTIPKKTTKPTTTTTTTTTKSSSTTSIIPKIEDDSSLSSSIDSPPKDSLDSYNPTSSEDELITKKPLSSTDENKLSSESIEEEDSEDIDPSLRQSSSSESSLAASGKITCSEDVVDNMSTDGNFIGSISSIANNPYSCTLLSENVQYTQSGTKNVMRLTLDNKGCPSKCLNNSYTCAEVESTQKLAYGTYTFNLVPSPATNSITKAYIASGGKGQYSDIFFKINGNSTNLYYGYTYFGVLVQFTEPLPGADFTLFHNYTFIYTSTGISWYFDKLLLKNKIDATYVSSGARIPLPPMNYYVSLTNNQEKNILSSKLPTFAEISLFNYISAPCLNDTSEDSNSELYTNWKTSPIGYFTSNCTSYRPIDIYNDTFQGFWKDKSNTLVIDPSSQFVRTGNSIGFALNRGNDYFRLHVNETIPVKRHKYLSFWLNGGNSGKQSLVLYLTYNSLRVGIANIGDYLLGGIEAGVWYKVIIPLQQIPINPSNITKIDGFMIQGTNSLFMDMVYLDDIQFSNGSVCMDLKNKTNKNYYDKGEFDNGANHTYSSGNINFSSRANLFRGYNTIEFQVSSFNNLLISLENGTLDTNQYDGIVFDLYFEPDPNYQFPGLENTESNEDILKNIPPKQLNAAICLGEETINAQLPCMGITQYVGGEFPANRWIELQIPFSDLFAFKNAMITSFAFKTNIPEHQGSLYIGKIMAAHFVPPFHEEEDSSIASSINSSFYSLLLSSTLFVLSFIFLI